MKLYDWRRRLEQGQFDRATVVLRQVGSQATPIATVTLFRAWPARYEVVAYPDGTLAERVTIVSEGTTHE
jgi:hypothetical protein